METQWICLSNGGWRYDLKHSRRWSLWSHCSKVSLTVYHICEIKCLWNIWDAVNVILVMSLSSCGRLKSMSMWGSFSRFRVKIQKQSHRVALLLLVTAFCKPSNLLFFSFWASVEFDLTKFSDLENNAFNYKKNSLWSIAISSTSVCTQQRV